MEILQSIFLLITLISFCHIICKAKEKGPKQCDPVEQYKCGDVCAWKGSSCSCGNVTLSKYSPYYCCLAPEDKCSHDGYTYNGHAKNPVCSNGKPMQRSESCHEVCPNDNSTMKKIDGEDHVTCSYEEHLSSGARQ